MLSHPTHPHWYPILVHLILQEVLFYVYPTRNKTYLFVSCLVIFSFLKHPIPKTLRKMSVPTQNLLQRVFPYPSKKTVLTSSLWIIWLSNLDLVYQVTGQIFNLWKNLSFGKKLDLTYLCLGHKKSHLFETLVNVLLLNFDLRQHTYPTKSVENWEFTFKKLFCWIMGIKVKICPCAINIPWKCSLWS